MKITFLLHQFYPTCQYGAETYAYHLAQGLQQIGHQVQVFHRENHIPRQFAPRQILQAEDVDVDGLAVRRLYLNPGYVKAFNFLSTFYNPPIEREFAAYLDREKPDLLHIHHLLYLSGGLPKLAKERGIPIIATLHDFWSFCLNAQLLRPNHQVCVKNPLKWYCGWCLAQHYQTKLPSWLMPFSFPLHMGRDRYLRRAMAHADLILSPSRFLMQRHIQAGFPAEKMDFLEYGINLAELKVPRRRSETTLPLRFGYIGSLTQHKGVHVLLEAFKQVPPEKATLDVYGSPHAFPDYAADLHATAESMPHVKFHGAFDHARIGEVLAGLDMIVVPSVWYENSPVTIREAIAAKVPVIASNIGSLPEKVRHGVDGLLFDVDNGSSLAAQLHIVIDDPERITRFRQNLHPPSDLDSHLQAMLSHYTQLRSRR